jgi:CheY-like chemotaxis protein
LRAEAFATASGLADLFLEVSDGGPGIPANEQELIFQKFVRGSAAKRANTPGTGLGLATCRMLAKAMNGSVGLESSPGGGATFYLQVLVAPPPASVPVKIEESAAGGAQVLIVEDEAYNQTVLQGMALELNFRPSLAANSEEAFAAIARTAFDVIFLDWELPGLKGGEIARQVRAQSGGDRPLIIATTAHDSDAMRQRCQEAGMNGFLLKPFTKERVRRLIADLRDPPGESNVQGEGPARNQTESFSRKDQLNLEAFTLYTRARPQMKAGAIQDYVNAVEHELVVATEAGMKSERARLQIAAHRLRALGGVIGAAEFTRIAGQIEGMEGTGENGPGHALEALQREWVNVKKRVQQE